MERFWGRVAPEDPVTKCREWLGQKEDFGYGTVCVSSHPKCRMQLTHRVAWEITSGPIQAGLCVLHRCDNPPCVNPDHLFLGTRPENSRDMVAKGRSTRGRGKKTTECEVREIKARLAFGVRRGALNRLSEEFGIPCRRIQAIACGRSWSWVGIDERFDWYGKEGEKRSVLE